MGRKFQTRSVAMSFKQEKVQDNRPDGYYLEPFPFKVGDTIPFLVGYGLGTSTADSKVGLFINPHDKKYQLVSVD